MTPNSNSSKAAFTLVEMLVVIAIIAIIASLVAGGAKYAAEKKKISRVQTELANLESVIERYFGDQGFYPPGGTNPFAPPLYYELRGTRFDGTQYRSLNGDEAISDSALQNTFGTSGFANSNPETAKNYFSSLKTNQYSRLQGSDLEVLIVPVEGPTEPAVLGASGKQLNTWRYVSNKPTNNVATYDLWADILIGSKTNRIGNWKE